MKSVVNGEAILFIGGHYEIKNPGSGQTVTKYYFAGASRIAMRKYTIPQSTTLTYLLGDHLGSTSLAVDASTGEAIETRYKPWGEVRYTTPNMTLPTRYTYTGQYSYINDDATDLGSAGFGLMFYNARWMDPAIGRFVQADTIVPGGVQGLDRYAYVNNSPINYIDPSGHESVCTGANADPECSGADTWSLSFVDSQYGITFTNDWSVRNKDIVRTAVQDVAAALLQAYNQSCGWTENCTLSSGAGFFNMVYGGVEFAWVTSYTDPQGNIYTDGAITKNAHRIEFASLPISGGYKTPEMAFKEGVNNVVHELGHAFGTRWYRKDGSGYDPSGPYVNIPNSLISNDGFYPSPVSAELTWRQHPCASGYDCPSEVYADMFLGWTYGMWADNSAGIERRNFMGSHMAPWIVNLVSP